ncbi:MAG: hypothetical protein HY652_13560 [Acidobacteria bacterium]|nr:hypothetical protein [Acidobacteriota bacterium]
MRGLVVVMALWALIFSCVAPRLWREPRGFGAAASVAADPAYPKPRYPKIPKITDVEPLLENARIIASRPMPYSGDQFPGWEIKGGEKVLFVVPSHVDPLVVDAFVQAMRRMNCRVDTLITDSPIKKIFDAADIMEMGLKGGAWFASDSGGLGSAEWLQTAAPERGYDKLIGVNYLQSNELLKGYGLDWTTREMLADESVPYPMDLVQALDYKGWEKLRQAQKVHLTDPEGTDYSFTWFPEYWEVIEGKHPKIQVAGWGSHIYGPGRSEIPLISSHLMGYPLGIILDRTDGQGVIAGTSDHIGPYPHLKITLRKNQMEKIEGGGRFGDLWREFLRVTKDVHYPHYPAPGSKYLIEAAIGTHPKVARPHNVMETIAGRVSWAYERNRSGIIHMGLGQLLSTAWAIRRGVQASHWHVHLYFPTYAVTMADGKEAKVIDKGHLTALDDPEIRQLASKYGNPDDLLTESWVPAMPGINTAGDYWKDYAPDPAAWAKKEHRQAYSYIIDYRPYP